MDGYALALAIFLTVLLSGSVLIFIWSVVSTSMFDRRLKDIEKSVMKCGKQLIVEATSECMDILPEKILEAKKTIEGE